MKLRDSHLLSTRITIGILLIVVAAGAVSLFVENSRIREEYLTQRRADLAEALNAEESRMNTTIIALQQDVLFLSATPPIFGIMRAAGNQEAPVWKERLQQIFSAFLAAHPDYYKIRFIDGTGNEIVRVDRSGKRIAVIHLAGLHDRADRDYFKAAQALHEGQVHLSEFNFRQEVPNGEGFHSSSLHASIPVFSPDGKVFGVVVINMDASHMLKSVTSGLPAGMQAYISNSDGKYLVHPDARQLLPLSQAVKGKVK